MSFDELITEKFTFFEVAEIDADELELLHHRKTTLDNCKYYTSELITNQNSAFSGTGKFTLIHHNVRSLQKNGEQFRDNIYNLNVPLSCILVTETWLKENSVPPVLQNFNFVKQNRIGRSGGGVGIYLRSSLNYIIREDLKCNNDVTETIFVEIKGENCKNILLGCIYRPPEGSIPKCLEELEILFEKLRNENKIIYIGGDFNINLLNYPNDGNVSQFIELFLSLGLYPTINRPTRVSNSTNTLIDCIFTNFLGPATSGVIADTLVSDHFPIILSCNSDLKVSKPIKVNKRTFHPDRIKKFRKRLTVLFQNFSHIDCPNEALNHFCNTIESEIDKFFPLCERHRKLTPLRPWIDNDLLQRINVKNEMQKKYLKNKSGAEYVRFTSFRNKLKSDIRIARRKYYQRLLQENQSNAKRSWQILNEVSGRVGTRTCGVKQVHCNGQIITNQKKIADVLNDFFSSVGTKINDSLPPSTADPSAYILNEVPETCFLDPVTSDEIRAILMELKDTGGTNNPICSKVLKLLSPAIIGPISHIVNLTFKTGCFPDHLKISSVTPIFKQGIKEEPGNYRPISVLSPLSKIIEKCLKDRILSFLECKGVFSQSQYGFRSKHSTEHALIKFMDYATDELEKGNFVVGVYLDIKKAFDCVNFQILFKKLSKYGIRGKALELIQNYLRNRKQKVKLADDNGAMVFSELRNITCGVPQGSVLGPLLFLIYINDLQNASALFRVITFADDTNLFMAAPSMQSLFQNVNMELDKIQAWFESNRLSINVSKTCFQLYSKRPIQDAPQIKINNASVRRASSVKFLGVIVDEKLTFKEHIAYVAKKLSIGIGFLYRGREVLNYKQLTLLYNAILVPHITYCNLVWGINYPTYINKLYILQKRAARVILGLRYNDPVSHRLHELSMVPISQIIRRRCMIMIYKIKHSLAPRHMQNMLCWRPDDSATPCVRQRGPMIVPYARTKYKQHTFKIFAPKLLNSLSALCPVEFNVSISMFKTCIAKVTDNQ